MKMEKMMIVKRRMAKELQKREKKTVNLILCLFAQLICVFNRKSLSQNTSIMKHSKEAYMESWWEFRLFLIGLTWKNSIISALNWIKRKIMERRCAFVRLLTIINISQGNFDLYRVKLFNFFVSKNQSFETTELWTESLTYRPLLIRKKSLIHFDTLLKSPTKTCKLSENQRDIIALFISLFCTILMHIVYPYFIYGHILIYIKIN